jgi:predicted ATPase/DNA-binding SARP family transcriptional activator
MLEVRLLGRFEIRRGTKTVEIPSRRAQSLFAFLILNAGTAFRREKLAGQLWPDSTEEAARDYLRHALWRIRQALEPVSASRCIQAHDLTISFDASARYWLDAASLQKAEEVGPIDQLADALSAYTGELLPGFYEEWVVLERDHLQAVYDRKVDCLLQLLLAADRHREVLEWAEKWIALGQRPEAAFRYLMSAYAAQGDMAKVAAAFERCVKSLAEYGVGPSEETLSIYQGLKAGNGSAKAQLKPTQLKHTAAASWNVPNPLTSFIGREQETADVVLLLEENRLVSLTGPGGVGKTRLAIQAANASRSKFKNGVCWIELAPLTDSNLVKQAIAGALDIREWPDQSLTAALAQYLSSKQLLLILDNCEHLILACAQVVESLAAACPKLTILTTSREALGIPGERTYEVPTLSVPEIRQLTVVDRLMEHSSIRLFVERATAVKPEFELTEQNASAVYQICLQLDGIPLALELAAARTKLLSVEHIAARLNDRFNLLTSGSRTALPRQQTLRATIDWSYDLLPEDARVLFRRCSVFAGGFTLESAESVCSQAPLSSQSVLDLLARLVDRSLVKMVRVGALERYSLLETVREYAHEKLNKSGEANEMRRRHRDFYVALAELSAPKLKGADQISWLDRLQEDQDNVRSAWEFCFREEELEAAGRLVCSFFHYWPRRGNISEGRIWTNRLLERPEAGMQPGRHADILGVAGYLAFVQRDFPAAKSMLEQSVTLGRIAGNREATAWALQWLGRIMNLSRGDSKAVRPIMEEALAMYRDLGNHWGIAFELYHLSGLDESEGHYEEARAHGRESLAIFQELGDVLMIGVVLGGLADIAQSQENLEEAGEYQEQCLRNARATGSIYVTANTCHDLAWIRLRQGRASAAGSLFEESLRLSNEYGNKPAALSSLAGTAAVLLFNGQVKEATGLLGAVEASLDENAIRDVLETRVRDQIDHYRNLVKLQLEDPILAEAWREGQAMGLEQAIEQAMDIALADVA